MKDHLAIIFRVTLGAALYLCMVAFVWAEHGPAQGVFVGWLVAVDIFRCAQLAELRAELDELLDGVRDDEDRDE